MVDPNSQRFKLSFYIKGCLHVCHPFARVLEAELKVLELRVSRVPRRAHLCKALLTIQV